MEVQQKEELVKSLTLEVAQLLVEHTKDSLNFGKFVKEQFDNCVSRAILAAQGGADRETILFNKLLLTHEAFCFAVNNIQFPDDLMHSSYNLEAFQRKKVQIKTDMWAHLTIYGSEWCAKQLGDDTATTSSSSSSSSSSSQTPKPPPPILPQLTLQGKPSFQEGVINSAIQYQMDVIGCIQVPNNAPLKALILAYIYSNKFQVIDDDDSNNATAGGDEEQPRALLLDEANLDKLEVSLRSSIMSFASQNSESLVDFLMFQQDPDEKQNEDFALQVSLIHDTKSPVTMLVLYLAAYLLGVSIGIYKYSLRRNWICFDPIAALTEADRKLLDLSKGEDGFAFETDLYRLFPKLQNNILATTNSGENPSWQIMLQMEFVDRNDGISVYDGTSFKDAIESSSPLVCKGSQFTTTHEKNIVALGLASSQKTPLDFSAPLASLRERRLAQLAFRGANILFRVDSSNFELSASGGGSNDGSSSDKKVGSVLATFSLAVSHSSVGLLFGDSDNESDIPLLPAAAPYSPAKLSRDIQNGVLTIAEKHIVRLLDLVVEWGFFDTTISSEALLALLKSDNLGVYFIFFAGIFFGINISCYFLNKFDGESCATIRRLKRMTEETRNKLAAEILTPADKELVAQICSDHKIDNPSDRLGKNVLTFLYTYEDSDGGFFSGSSLSELGAISGRLSLLIPKNYLGLYGSSIEPVKIIDGGTPSSVKYQMSSLISDGLPLELIDASDISALFIHDDMNEPVEGGFFTNQNAAEAFSMDVTVKNTPQVGVASQAPAVNQLVLQDTSQPARRPPEAQQLPQGERQQQQHQPHLPTTTSAGGRVQKRTQFLTTDAVGDLVSSVARGYRQSQSNRSDPKGRSRKTDKLYQPRQQKKIRRQLPDNTVIREDNPLLQQEKNKRKREPAALVEQRRDDDEEEDDVEQEQEPRYVDSLGGYRFKSGHVQYLVLFEGYEGENPALDEDCWLSLSDLENVGCAWDFIDRLMNGDYASSGVTEADLSIISTGAASPWKKKSWTTKVFSAAELRRSAAAGGDFLPANLREKCITLIESVTVKEVNTLLRSVYEITDSDSAAIDEVLFDPSYNWGGCVLSNDGISEMACVVCVIRTELHDVLYCLEVYNSEVFLDLLYDDKWRMYANFDFPNEGSVGESNLILCRESDEDTGKLVKVSRQEVGDENMAELWTCFEKEKNVCAREGNGAKEKCLVEMDSDQLWLLPWVLACIKNRKNK